MLGGISQESKNVQVSKKQFDAGARSLRKWIGLQVSAREKKKIAGESSRRGNSMPDTHKNKFESRGRWIIALDHGAGRGHRVPLHGESLLLCVLLRLFVRQGQIVVMRPWKRRHLGVCG